MERSPANVLYGDKTALVTGGDLGSRMTQFQRAIEARDGGAAAGLLHHDYALCLVVPSSAVIPRAAWLATLPDYVVQEWSVQELQIEELGDMAAVLQRGLQRATVHGQPRDGVFVISDIWEREGGVWRIWRRHSTPLTAGELPTD